MNLIIPFIFSSPLYQKSPLIYLLYIQRGLHRTGHVRRRANQHTRCPLDYRTAHRGHVTLTRRRFSAYCYILMSYSCAKPYKEQVVYKRSKMVVR